MLLYKSENEIQCVNITRLAVEIQNSILISIISLKHANDVSTQEK